MTAPTDPTGCLMKEIDKATKLSKCNQLESIAIAKTMARRVQLFT